MILKNGYQLTFFIQKSDLQGQVMILMRRYLFLKKNQWCILTVKQHDQAELISRDQMKSGKGVQFNC